MKDILKILLLYTLLLSGCSVNYEETDYEETVEEIDKDIVEEVVLYNNVSDGLLTKDNQYGLDVRYMILDSGNKKVGDKMKPTYIVIHNTANSAPAINEAKYLNSSSNTSSTSFHFAVDDNSVYQTVNLNYNAWHAGDISMNKKSIGIEIAKSTIDDNEIKNDAIKNGAKLTALLMKEYNIPLNRVVTHQAVSGKNCPHDILERYGYKAFLELVNKYLN